MNQPFSVNQYQLACAEFGISPSEDSEGPTLLEAVCTLKARLADLSLLLPPVQEVDPTRHVIIVRGERVVRIDHPVKPYSFQLKVWIPNFSDNHIVLPVSEDFAEDIICAPLIDDAWPIRLTLEVALEPTKPTP